LNACRRRQGRAVSDDARRVEARMRRENAEDQKKEKVHAIGVGRTMTSEL